MCQHSGQEHAWLLSARGQQLLHLLGGPSGPPALLIISEQEVREEPPRRNAPLRSPEDMVRSPGSQMRGKANSLLPRVPGVGRPVCCRPQCAGEPAGWVAARCGRHTVLRLPGICSQGTGPSPEQLETNTSARPAHLCPIWTPALSVLAVETEALEDGGWGRAEE